MRVLIQGDAAACGHYRALAEAGGHEVARVELPGMAFDLVVASGQIADLRQRHPDAGLLALVGSTYPAASALAAGADAVERGDADLATSELRWLSLVHAARGRVREGADAFFRRLLDAIPSPVFIFDETTCLASNQANAVLFGRSSAQLEGLKARDQGFSPSESARFAEQNRQIMATRQPMFVADVPVTDSSGAARWFQLRKAPIEMFDGRTAVIGVAEEVTLRKQAEQSLRRSEENLRSLIENARDGLLVHRGGPCLYANPALARMLGVDDPAQLIGIDPSEWVMPEEQGDIAMRRDALSGGAPRGTFLELRIRRRDGQPVHVQAHREDIQFDGAPASMTVLRDLTERRELELKLLQSERLATLGSVAAGLAHEINNPLAFVLTNVEFALEGLAGAHGPSQLGDVLGALRDARDGAERVRVLVRDLKLFARVEQGDDDHEVELADVLRLSLAMARPTARHHTRVIEELGPTPKIKASASKLGQVFLNLLVNAIEAMPPHAPERNVLRVVSRTDELGRAVVAISDTGVGIAEEHRARVFDPFFTLKPIGVGTGLGLSICHGVVSALGGEISFTSELGVGTTFSVTLPAAAPGPSSRSTASASTSAAPASPAPAQQAPRRRVLIVDDEPKVAEAARRILSRLYDVAVSPDGRGALERLEHEPFDAVVCDLMMPNLDGGGFYAELERMHPELALRVVFMSGGAVTAVAERFRETIARRLVSKPFLPSTLRDAVALAVALAP